MTSHPAPQRHRQRHSLSDHTMMSSRGQAPGENQSRQDYNRQTSYSPSSYSQAIRTGLPIGGTHDISKSNYGANSILIATTLGSSVANMNPQMGQPTQMPGNTASVGSAQAMQVPQQMAQMSKRYAPGVTQHYQHQTRSQNRTQMPGHGTHRNPNQVATSTGVVQQTAMPGQHGQQNQSGHQLNHANHSHTQSAPHYILIAPPHPSHPTQPHPAVGLMSSPAPYQPHQPGFQPPMHRQPGYPFGYPGAQLVQTPAQFSGYYTTPPYGYGHQQMITPMGPRTPINSNPASINQLVTPMPPTASDLNEATPVQPQKQTLEKRQRNAAVIQNPTTGHTYSEEELKSTTPIAKDQVDSNSLTNESQSGASSLRNSPATSVTKSNDIDVAMEFATAVAKAATEPMSVTDATSTSTVESSTPKVGDNETNSGLSDRISENVDEVTCKEPKVSVESATNEIEVHVNATLTTQTSDDRKSQVSVNLKTRENSCVQSKLQQNGEAADAVLLDTDQAKEEPELKVNASQKKKDLVVKQEKEESQSKEKKKEEPEDVPSKSAAVSDEPSKSVSTESSTPFQTVIFSDKQPVTSEEKVLDNDKNVLNNKDEVEKKNAENIRLQNIQSDPVAKKEEKQVNNVDSAQASQQPKLPYAEDQWSPENPGGKKQYDKKFLLALQNSEIAMKMPEKLSKLSIDIVRDTPHAHDFSTINSSSTCDDFFLPNFASRQGSHYRMPNVGRRQSQPGRGGHLEKQRKVISTSLNQDVKLHTSENAWKPKKVDGTVDPDEQETLELLKNVRGILNKLTPQKYNSLVNQIMDLKFDTEDKLRRVLDLIFEKAVDEPAFCLQYANLCKKLANKTIKVDNRVEAKLFQKILLTKCQKEFESDIYAGVANLEERQREINECQDKEKKKMLYEILDDEMRRARKRSLGNIKLIGELYKLNMLKGNIMVQCIQKLCAETNDDESLECLCALLKTIGEQMEKEDNINAANVLDFYFGKLSDIASQKLRPNTSARVRFMVRDIIELRHNKWKPRRENEGPKMIDEIHQEVKQEEERKQQELEQHKLQKRFDPDKRKGGRQHEGENWTVITGRKSQNQPTPANIPDFAKMQRSMNTTQEVKLGPTAISWSQGSHGGSASSQSKTSGVDEKTQNRFSPLGQNPDNRNPKRPTEFPSRDSSKGRPSSQTGQMKSHRDKNKEDALLLVRRLVPNRPPQSSTPPFAKPDSGSSSRDNSAPNSRNSSVRLSTPDLENRSLLKGKSDISIDELIAKTKESVKEYLSIDNLEEPVKDVIEVFHESNVHIYINSAINYAFEITSQNGRVKIGKLLSHLLVNSYVTTEQILVGLNEIFEIADDIELDVPLFWDYLAAILAPVLADLPTDKWKEFFLDIFEKCKIKARLIAKIIYEIAKLTNPEHAQSLWVASKLQWNDFQVPSQTIENFVVENNVEFTIKEMTQNSDKPHESYTKRLEILNNEIMKMVEMNKSNDEIYNVIEKYFTINETSESRFTSALFKAVIRGCLKDGEVSFTLDKSLLEQKALLLQKFLGGNAEAEFQALLVLQQLMEELQHPGGLLCSIFESLYNSEVISKEAFLQWYKPDDPNVKGKAVAAKSATRFFTWLIEPDDGEDDEDENSS